MVFKTHVPGKLFLNAFKPVYVDIVGWTSDGRSIFNETAHISVIKHFQSQGPLKLFANSANKSNNLHCLFDDVIYVRSE